MQRIELQSQQWLMMCSIYTSNCTSGCLCCDHSLCWDFIEADRDKSTKKQETLQLSPHNTSKRWRDSITISSNQTVDSFTSPSCKKSGALRGGAAWRRTSLWSSTWTGKSFTEMHDVGLFVSMLVPYSWQIRLQRSPSVSSGNISSRIPSVFSLYL